mgnify:FL=1
MQLHLIALVCQKKVATLSLDFTTTYDLLNYMLNDNRVEKDKFYIGTIDSNDDCNISGNFVEPGKRINQG